MTLDRLEEDLSSGFRLSPQQEQIWAAEGSLSRRPLQCAIRIRGDLDDDRLRSVLDELAMRHEILRTVFRRAPGMQVGFQTVREEPAWILIRRTEPADLDALLADEADVPLDLGEGPPLRVALVAEGEDSVLVLSLPAICADAASLGLLARELGRLYEGLPIGGEPLQYADYAEWRQELAASDDADATRGRRFWEERPRDNNSSPLLFGRAASTGGRVSRVRGQLDQSLVDSVKEAAAQLGTTPSLFLESCWHTLVARLSGETDIHVDGSFAGRDQEELVEAVGAFAQWAIVRTQIESATSLAEVVEQIRRTRNETARWHDYRSDEQFERTETAFAFTESPDGGLGDLIAVSSVHPSAPLQLDVLQTNGACRLELRFDPDAYVRDDAERLVRWFVALVSTAVNDPETTAGRLAFLSEDELRDIRETGEGPRRAFPPTCVHHLFEEHVLRIPEEVAVRDAAGTISYRDLDSASNRLAHYLRELGVDRNVPVGLCLDRSIEMVVSLLAILKAGGAYLPLSYDHPRARLEQQLGQAGVTIVVSQTPFADRFSTFKGKVVYVDGERDTLLSRPASTPPHVNEPQDLVYVMYTSGSTGVPKGVAVTHSNLANYTLHMIDRFAAGDSERLEFAVVSAISTDLGNTSVFPALASGGGLTLISPEASMNADAFASTLAEARVDVLKITPSHFEGLLGDRMVETMLPSRWLVLGGEACSWTLAERLRTPAGCRVLNHYGPTETTVGSCTFELGTEVSLWGPRMVPIGKPISNTQTYVLDNWLEPVPAGVAGELYIGGAGVTQGYVGAPEQTADRFVPHPFGGEGHLYRTGDRVRMLGDGNLEFLGRVDHQVKIRGYRVEPAEIEVVLASNPSVRQAAVVSASAAGTPTRLVAYVVPRDPAPSVDDLRSSLLEVLPEFMIPSEFVYVESFPLTASGKIDRLALAATEKVAPDGETEYVAPRDGLEEALAGIWREVLGLERVGVTDDFFVLGGHSLMAMQVIARIRARLETDVDLFALFASPTVAGLAEAIRADAAAPKDSEVDDLVDELSGLSDEQRSLLLKSESPLEGER